MSMTSEQRSLLSLIGGGLLSRGPWTVDTSREAVDRGSAALMTPTGERIWFRFEDVRGTGGSKTVLTAHPDWPKNKGTGGGYRDIYPANYELQASSINISLSKSPAQIAKEIERRFMPDYLKAWDQQLAKLNASNDYETIRQASYTRLANEAGATVRRDPNDNTRVFCDWPGRDLNGGYVRDLMVNSNTMQMQLCSVPMDKAIKILNILHAKNG